jgi:rod shape-determining protein MreD
MLAMLILQVAVLPRFPVLGLVPQFSLLAATSWGLLRGPEEGALWAFVGGFLLDLYTSGPIGAMTLSMMAAVLIVALVKQNFPASSFFLPILYAALATVVYLVVYLVLARLLGSEVTTRSVTLLLPLILIDALAMLPIHWSLGRLARFASPRRVEIR